MPEHRNWQQQTCISPEPGVKANRQWGRVGWMLADHRDGLSSSSFLAWSSIAQSVCQWAFSLLVIWCLRPWVRILHSAEEDNLSPFDSKIVCPCQSIEINNMHVCICIYLCVYVCHKNGWELKKTLVGNGFQLSALHVWTPSHSAIGIQYYFVSFETACHQLHQLDQVGECLVFNASVYSSTDM